MKTGDPITTVVMLDGGRLCIAVALVESVFELAPRPGFRWKSGIACLPNVTIDLHQAAEDRFFDDEGITWLPGWWQLCEETEALLAGAALGAAYGALPAQSFNSDYSSGGYVGNWRYELDGYLDDDNPLYKDRSR